ncbi:MAG: Na+/H+ antiporter subunit E [Rhodovibrionaceae bacterium]
MLRKLLPHPLLTLLLTAVWIMLLNSVSLGGLLLGLILGLLIPLYTAAYWPNRPRLRNPLMIVEYILVVLLDIVIANVVVAKTILFKRNSAMKSGFVAVPLDLRTPEAITVLAGTITMTPGTVSSDLSADGRSLLVHHLDAPNSDELRDTIKQRYERRLKEIFE